MAYKLLGKTFNVIQKNKDIVINTLRVYKFIIQQSQSST